MVFSDTKKYEKETLFSSRPAKNSTTGCEEMAKAVRMVKKVTKSDQKVTLFSHSGQPLTVSMGKSLPF